MPILHPTEDSAVISNVAGVDSAMAAADCAPAPLVGVAPMR
jgi:hypothetical protein